MNLKDLPFGKLAAAWLDRLLDVSSAVYGLFVDKDSLREEALREVYGYDATSLSFNPETTETLLSLDSQIRKICDFRDMDASSIGYPVVSVDAILAAHHTMITNVFAAAGLSNEQLNELLLPAIRELARTVHLIPASGGYHHKDCGGLFVHSLETAWAAGQKCKGNYFSINPTDPNISETQRKMQLAVILAGLCHDAGKALSDITVRTEAGNGERFSPHSEKLYDWMVAKKLTRYFVYWKGKGKDHEAELVNLYNDLISKKVREYLGERISYELYKYFTGQFKVRGQSALADIVNDADQESTALDRRRGQFDRSHTTLFDRECTNFFTAVKRLLLIGSAHHDGKGDAYPTKVKGIKILGWTVNSPDGAMLLTADGKLFIDWERFIEVRKIYQTERVNSGCFDTGVALNEEEGHGMLTPEDGALSLLEVLNAEGFLALNEGAGKYKSMQFFWRVGRFDVNDPEAEIKPIKAVCLTKEAAGKIFIEPEDAPSELRIYAVFGNGEEYTKPQIVFATEKDREDFEKLLEARKKIEESLNAKNDPHKKAKVQTQDSGEEESLIDVPSRRELERRKRRKQAKEDGIVNNGRAIGKLQADEDGVVIGSEETGQTEEPLPVQEKDNENEEIERVTVDPNELTGAKVKDKEDRINVEIPDFNFRASGLRAKNKENEDADNESNQKETIKAREESQRDTDPIGNQAFTNHPQTIRPEEPEGGCESESNFESESGTQFGKDSEQEHGQSDNAESKAESEPETQTQAKTAAERQSTKDSEQTSASKSESEQGEEQGIEIDTGIGIDLDMSFFSKGKGKKPGTSKNLNALKPQHSSDTSKNDLETKPALQRAGRQQRVGDKNIINSNSYGEKLKNNEKIASIHEACITPENPQNSPIHVTNGLPTKNIAGSKHTPDAHTSTPEQNTQVSTGLVDADDLPSLGEDEDQEDIDQIDIPWNLEADIDDDIEDNEDIEDIEDNEDGRAEETPTQDIVVREKDLTSSTTNLSDEQSQPSTTASTADSVNGSSVAPQPSPHELTEEEEEAIKSQEIPFETMPSNPFTDNNGNPETVNPTPTNPVVEYTGVLPFDRVEDFPMNRSAFKEALAESLKIGAAAENMVLSVDPALGPYLTCVQLEDLAKLASKTIAAQKELLMSLRTIGKNSVLSYEKLSGRLYLNRRV